MEESSGLVLVLLPGGKFWMGAQRSDPQKPNHDPQAVSDEGPVHEVELSAFFLSKYEMTQGQWKRFAGRNPSRDGPDGLNSRYWNSAGLAATLLEPVERVSWTDCMRELERMGLALPSEAQWEYGARGGEQTAWWSGAEHESLAGVANLADLYARDHRRSEWPGIEEWLDDGYTSHAPVDTLLANPFGLHHVHGNVWEWCLDGYKREFYGQSPGLDPVSPHTGSVARVTRGGSFYNPASDARSAYRNSGTPERRPANLGLRPAKGITP